MGGGGLRVFAASVVNRYNLKAKTKNKNLPNKTETKARLEGNLQAG